MEAGHATRRRTGTSRQFCSPSEVRTSRRHQVGCALCLSAPLATAAALAVQGPVVAAGAAVATGRPETGTRVSLSDHVGVGQPREVRTDLADLRRVQLVRAHFEAPRSGSWRRTVSPQESSRAGADRLAYVVADLVGLRRRPFEGEGGAERHHGPGAGVSPRAEGLLGRRLAAEVHVRARDAFRSPRRRPQLKTSHTVTAGTCRTAGFVPPLTIPLSVSRQSWPLCSTRLVGPSPASNATDTVGNSPRTGQER